MLKGISIVITGHPYYGRWAYNLAVSIKAIEKFPIALLYTDSAIRHLSDRQKAMFDKLIPLPTDSPINTSCKLLAGRYSPWNETLLLDADMLWLPGKAPSKLFEEVGDCDFSGITEGNEQQPAKGYFFWADVEEIKSKYELKAEIYQFRSEVVYFTDEGRAVLNRAAEITKNTMLTTVKKFGQAVPDELGINIACAEMGMRPHVFKWKPSYWHLQHNNFVPGFFELALNYYLISFGSNNASGTIKKVYDQLMRNYCMRLGIDHVFSLESKRNIIPERAKE